MRVFVSVDMEGISGLTDPEDMLVGGRGYDRGCEIMTADANAAVGAAFDAGAAEVVVTDAHGSTKNLRADLIDPRCTLVRGRTGRCGWGRASRPASTRRCSWGTTPAPGSRTAC
jgi:D-amino peptidase